VTALLRLLPPVLLVRLLDDIHAFAEFTKVLGGHFEQCLDLAERLDQDMAKALPVMRKMSRATDTSIPLMEQSIPLMREANRNMAAALPVMQGMAPAISQATMPAVALSGALGRVGRAVDRRKPGRAATGD
jgi:hypothetical protein